MFSYQDYQEIINIIKSSGRAADFEQAQSMDRFIIMRHDVEFSVDRAYRLAVLEAEMDFKSTYFFQWTNNCYNLLSVHNEERIRKMREMGHRIGLHFALNGLTDMEQIKAQIQKEIRVLSEMLGFEIREFSFHRPPAEVLRENIKLPGIRNAYQDDYFSFAEQVTADTALDVRYFSDAQHRWNYGLIPDKETIEKYDKVQILTHPYSWTPQGYDNLGNFRSLIAEKNQELKESINRECKHFAAVREQLED